MIDINMKTFREFLLESDDRGMVAESIIADGVFAVLKGMLTLRRKAQKFINSIKTNLLKVRMMVKMVSGTDPFLTACLLKNYRMIAELLEDGADPNTVGPGGFTPLIISLENPGIVKLLLRAGADPNGMIPISAGITTSVLGACAISGESRSMVNIIKAGGKVNYANELGWTPLHYALMSNEHECAKVLIENGADVNAKGKDDSTGLHLVVFESSKDKIECAVKCAKLLIENGAEVNAVKKDTNVTPIEAALFMKERGTGSDEMIRILIEAGADTSKIRPEILAKHIPAKE